MFKFLYHFGRYLLLLRSSFSFSERFGVYYRATLNEAIAIGIGSVFIVFTINLFIGAVTTVQTAYQLSSGFFPKSIIGYVVSASGLLELAPTVTSLILAGKVGSNITSEIGTMRVSEQIDALDVMGINSASFIILPKIIASVLVFPALVIVAAFVLHVGGMAAGELTGEVNAATFTEGVRQYNDPFYIPFMLIKATCFGFIISSVSSFFGYFVQGGAVEVGKAGTRAVVVSSIAVIVADFVLAQLLL